MSLLQIIPNPVLQVFQEVSPAHRHALLDVRELIFEVAASDPRFGQIGETLRWG